MLDCTRSFMRFEFKLENLYWLSRFISVNVCVGIGGSITEDFVFERFIRLLTFAFDSTFEWKECF